MRISATLAVTVVALGTGVAGMTPAAGAAVRAPGPGGGPSISATAPGKAAQHGALGGKVRSGNKAGDVAAGKGAHAGGSARSVRCWNGRRSGRVFYETCSGRRYRPFVDCSNHHRYYSKRVYSGKWNFRLVCPRGTRAVWGGARG